MPADHVQPRSKNRMNNTGIGTPRAHRRIQPILPFSLDSIAFLIIVAATLSAPHRSLCRACKPVMPESCRSSRRRHCAHFKPFLPYANFRTLRLFSRTRRVVKRSRTICDTKISLFAEPRVARDTSSATAAINSPSVVFFRSSIAILAPPSTLYSRRLRSWIYR